jgi:hypothetical protein
MSTPEDEVRFAQIGRAVVQLLIGGEEDNPIAWKEATSTVVISRLERIFGEYHTLLTCDALKVGRLVLSLSDIIKGQQIV